MLWAEEMMSDCWFALPDVWMGESLDLLTADGEDEREAAVVDEGDELPADELGVSVYSWGRRVSGFSFSPGDDLSAVWYDKLLEERLSGKRWMEVVHRAGGWRPGMPLTRIEVRFRRATLRDLMTLHAGDRANSEAE
jgi:hypothetical protein